MNRLLRKITAYLLLSAFSVILAPEYLVHEFTGHKDTVESYFGKGLVVTQKHIHCESLQLQVQFFTETESVSLPSVFIQHTELSVAPVKNYSFNNQYYTSLRGPPLS